MHPIFIVLIVLSVAVAIVWSVFEILAHVKLNAPRQRDD